MGTAVKGKGGHPQFKSATPQLRNSAILRTTKSIAELRTKKSCGIAIADLQNLTSAIPQLSTVSNIIKKTFHSVLPIPLRSSPFSLAQDGFKNQPTLFLELFVSLEQNLP